MKLILEEMEEPTGIGVVNTAFQSDDPQTVSCCATVSLYRVFQNVF